MKATSTVGVKVETGGAGVVAHVGLHALGAFADRLGLPGLLSAGLPYGGAGVPVHDRGKVLTQAMLMMAGGGEACSDIERLRAQPALFGQVPSDSTLYRTFFELDAPALAGLAGAVRTARAGVWSRAAATVGTSTVVLDVDSSLHEVHSEHKDQAAATYKGGYGFHPLYCFADVTGECLAVKLRSGNAGANDISDLVAIVDAAVAALPEDVSVGHRDGDNPAAVKRRLEVRADSAASRRFALACRSRNIGFCLVARSSERIHAAISRIAGNPDRWAPAITQDDQHRPGAAVAEITDLVDLSDWPPGTRLIIRREPLHPGAQQTLFPSLAYRYWGHYSDNPDTDPPEADRHMRAHAHVEDNIRRLKDSAAARFPFRDYQANTAWLAVVCAADTLVRWFQHLCLDGPLARAEPKTLRWQLWHTPARTIRRSRRHIIRILADWPTANTLTTAYKRINLIT